MHFSAGTHLNISGILIENFTHKNAGIFMRLLFSVILLTINSLLFSQPELSWLREYDTSSPSADGISLTETNNLDGSIICGYRTTPTTLQDLFLIRTNLTGDTIWTKQYGVPNGSDYGMKILKTGDGYVIGGMTVKYSIANWAAWLLKIDEDGDTLWSRTLLDSARINSVCSLPDGGFALTGIKNIGINYKAFISRTDADGNIIWLNFYGDYENSYAMDIVNAQDSSLLVMGAISNPPASTDNLWILKINNDGSAVSENVYETKCSWGKIHQTYKGNLILGAGYSGTVAFMKLDPDGLLLDSINYSAGMEDMPDIIQSPDSNFICLFSEGIGSNDYATIKIEKLDDNFNTIWTKEIYGDRNYSSVSFILTVDNGLLITGHSSEIPSGENKNILLLRLDGGIIPVELIAFEGGVENGKVILKWETSSETNNYGFGIERNTKTSIRKGWEEAGFVEGNGTSTEQHSYSYIDPVNPAGTISYRLKQIDLDGSFTYSKEITVESHPDVFSLSQNYPNPFNPVTRINYSIPVQSFVTLIIYNILGQKVSALVNEIKQPGNYMVDFDGSKIASGAYIYQLTSGKNILIRKMLMMK